MSDVDKYQDIIDSRDVIARIEELEELCADPDSEDTEEDQEELKLLKELQSEAEGSPDWQYGEGLIRNSYFEEYARDLAEDIGAINRDASWPNDCIDWDQAARALQMDYFSVDFDGVEYWIRA